MLLQQVKNKTNLTIQEIDLKNKIIEKKAELENSSLNCEIKILEDELKKVEEEKKSEEEKIINALLNNGVESIEKDGYIIKLSRRAGALKIDKEFIKTCSKEYIRTKTIQEIDKIKVKEDLKNGIVIPNATINENIKLIIKTTI